MKILVLGAGSIGRRHLTNLKSLAVEDLGVFDADASLTRQTADEFGITALASYQNALAWRADAVLICTPNHLHLHHASDFFHGGAHLFIEKPLASNWYGVPEFVEAVQNSRQVVLNGFNMR